MQSKFIGFTARMRILALTLLLSSALAFFPNMRLTKSLSDLQGARSKIALSDQQQDRNLLGEQIKEFEDGWKNLFSAGPTVGEEEEVNAAPPSKKPEDDKEVAPAAVVKVEQVIAPVVGEKKEPEFVKPVDDEIVAHKVESTKAIEQPKPEPTVVAAAEVKPEPISIKEATTKVQAKEEMKVGAKIEPKVEPPKAAVVVEEEVKEARVAPAAVDKPKPIPKEATKPAPAAKPIPAVPAMFTMNEVALKAEPALVNERNKDETVGMALRDIPMKSAEEVTKADDTKDVLKAQQAVARSFLSLLSSAEDNSDKTVVEAKPPVAKKEVLEVEAVVPPAAKVVSPPVSAATAVKKEEAKSNPLEGFLGFLKNDPALEQQRQQQAAKQQQSPKSQPATAVKQEVKSVAPAPAPAPPKAAAPVPAPIKIPAPMPVVSTAKKPEPPALDKLFGFLKSDPAFEYAQQQKAKEKANNRPSQPPAVARAIFSPAPPAPPAEPSEPVFQRRKVERPEVKVSGINNNIKKAEELLSLPKIKIPFLNNSNEKEKKEDVSAADVAKKAAPEVFERPVVAARSPSSSSPAKKAKIIISTTQAQPIVAVTQEAKKEAKPAISLPSFGFFGNQAPPAPVAAVVKKAPATVAVPKPAPVIAPAAPVVVAQKEEPSKSQGGGLFGFFRNNNNDKKDAAPAQAIVSKPVVATPSKPSPPVVASKPTAVVVVAGKAAPAPATTAAPTASKPAAGGGLFGFLNPSPVPPPKSTPAAVIVGKPAVAAKVEVKKPAVPATAVVSEPVKKPQAPSPPSGGLFGIFGGNNNDKATKKVEEKPAVVVASAKVAPKTVAPSAPVVATASKKVGSPSNNYGGGLFGIFGGAKKADSSADDVKPAVAAKPAAVQPSKAAPAATKAATLAAITITSSNSNSKSSSGGGLFGGLLGGGGSKPVASSPAATAKAAPASSASSASSAAGKATAMNPTFQKLVSKTLKNDSGKLATFQRSTDTLRAGTLDASRYVQAMDSLFGGPGTLGSILPPLIAELPEKDVAKKLQVAYDKYVKAIKPSAAVVKTVGAVIKAPEKVPVAKRSVVEGKMKAVAAGQLSVKDFVDYLNKDIGATRTKGFAADVAALLPKEKAAEFTKLVAQLK